MMNERIFLCISFVTNRERFYFISFSLFFLFCFVFLDCFVIELVIQVHQLKYFIPI